MKSFCYLACSNVSNQFQPSPFGTFAEAKASLAHMVEEELGLDKEKFKEILRMSENDHEAEWSVTFSGRKFYIKEQELIFS